MPAFEVHPAVAEAVSRGRPVVALESTIISHGLPRPDNLATARRVEQIVTEAGAVPATVAVVGGVARVGLTDAELELIASSDDVDKVAVRDLPACVAAGRHGATTVSATAHLAAQAGISVFATGGIGGVHREARDSWDESADLMAVARTPVLVVCAGVKSILDVAATLERLETLSVPVVGYGTATFPGFYLSSTGHDLAWSVASAADAAAVFSSRDGLGLGDTGMVLAVPLPTGEQLDPALHDRVLGEALARAAAEGISGAAVTPFLLEHFHANTQGASLAVNVRIIERNARVAAEVAVALAGAGSQ